jgi:hypothetical protein
VYVFAGYSGNLHARCWEKIADGPISLTDGFVSKPVIG